MDNIENFFISLKGALTYFGGTIGGCLGGIVSLIVIYDRLKQKPKKPSSTALWRLTGIAVVSLIVGGSASFFLPNEPSYLKPGTPWYTLNFSTIDSRENPQGWDFGTDWHIKNGLLNSTTSKYSRIYVPAPIYSPDYFLEVSLQIKVKADNNGKAGFGIAIHNDHSEDRTGYQGGVFPPIMYMRVKGQSNSNDSTSTFNPQADSFVTYRIEVQNTTARFYIDGKPYPSPDGLAATQYPDKGSVLIWKTGACEINIRDLTITAT